MRRTKYLSLPLLLNVQAGLRSVATCAYPKRLVATMMVVLLICALEVRAAEALRVAQPGQGAGYIAFWLETTLKRVYPGSPPGSTNLHLLAPRNGRVSFQACLRNTETAWHNVRCSLAGADDLKPRVRVVGFVPVRHFSAGTDPKELDGIGFMPGLVPDPLYPRDAALISYAETQPFWISLFIPPDTQPGVRELQVPPDRVQGIRMAPYVDLLGAEQSHADL